MHDIMHDYKFEPCEHQACYKMPFVQQTVKYAHNEHYYLLNIGKLVLCAM